MDVLKSVTHRPADTTEATASVAGVKEEEEEGRLVAVTEETEEEAVSVAAETVTVGAGRRLGDTEEEEEEATKEGDKGEEEPSELLDTPLANLRIAEQTYTTTHTQTQAHTHRSEAGITGIGKGQSER